MQLASCPQTQRTGPAENQHGWLWKAVRDADVLQGGLVPACNASLWPIQSNHQQEFARYIGLEYVPKNHRHIQNPSLLALQIEASISSTSLISPYVHFYALSLVGFALIADDLDIEAPRFQVWDLLEGSSSFTVIITRLLRGRRSGCSLTESSGEPVGTGNS